MIKFSANISLLFQEYEFLNRFDEAKQNGFNAIEFQFAYDFDAHLIKQKISKNNLEISVFNAPPGKFENGDRGLACLTERKEEFRQTIIQALKFGRIIGGKKIHVMAGISPNHNCNDYKNTYVENLIWASEQAENFGADILIEPINLRHFPDYFLHSTERAVELINEIDKPNISIQFDIFHHQIMRGDVVESIKRYLPYIGHIQIAGVPNRNEPDNSEINYDYIFKVIDDCNYKGWIGCEYNPKGNTLDGLKWIRKYIHF